MPGSGIPGSFLDNGSLPLIYGSRDSSQLGRWNFPVRNGVTTNGGTIYGAITDSASPPDVVRYVSVEACLLAGGCFLTQSADFGGTYILSGLPSGQYDIYVNPPDNSYLMQGFTTIYLPPNGDVEANISLKSVSSLPSNVTITHHRVNSDGTPVLEWSTSSILNVSGCSYGQATATITMNDQSAVIDVSMYETYKGSGLYTGTIPDPYPDHGGATVDISLTCPNSSQNQSLSFSIYIDPSGQVVDTQGNPIPGATVSLLYSDNPLGPFSLLPAGSTIMSPGNRQNPDMTTTDGTFGWDVLTGYYEVTASAPNCVSPTDTTSNTVTSSVFSVPPPITGLDLVLNCEKIPTALTYLGPLSADTQDAVNVSAKLTELNSTNPIVGASLVLTFAGQSCLGITDATGVATCSVTPDEPAGPATASAAYPGSTTYSATTTGPIRVNLLLEETAITLLGPMTLANNTTVSLSANLEQDGITPISGRQITLRVGQGATAQSCMAQTNAVGQATCQLVLSQSLGESELSASFSGDPYFQPAVATTPTIVFAYLEQGSFVITSSQANVGNTVTFWGAKWSQENGLSLSSFKGFADTLSSTTPHVGSTWSSVTGNSSQPPSNVPTFMAVIVSDGITQSGSTITGNVSEIAIIEVNPDYANNPGHSGTGTVVAMFS